MKLSVIILNYNVRYFLELCILSVERALEGIGGEIIVVDNNSADDSCEMIRQRFPNVKLIQNDENVGFPKGNNIGVAAASGEYICILNPDTVIAEDTFSKILSFAEKLSNPGIIGCKLIDGTGKFLPESKRGVPTPFVALTKVAGLYKVLPGVFGRYYAAHLSQNQTGKVEILVGAFMIMKRGLYLEIGGFDENCFMYSDDIDLSYMVLKSGRNNYYFADTTVIHYKGESTVRDGLYMKRFRDAMNFFYSKHFKSSIVFDAMMKLGATAFSVVKKNQAVTQKREIDKYILLSNDVLLQEKVLNLLGKEVISIDSLPQNELLSLAFAQKGNIEILIDAAKFDFKTIIAIMQAYQHQSVTFKIIVNRSGNHSRFMIGSNSSNDRGEVLLLS